MVMQSGVGTTRETGEMRDEVWRKRENRGAAVCASHRADDLIDGTSTEIQVRTYLDTIFLSHIYSLHSAHIHLPLLSSLLRPFPLSRLYCSALQLQPKIFRFPPRDRSICSGERALRDIHHPPDQKPVGGLSPRTTHNRNESRSSTIDKISSILLLKRTSLASCD
ncbi:hypothetical protein P152DRAFT_287658 [Eremomyces bilateralis CBS 781.70]|uniref:Uncharacterized protein n=1 Tax=Eremomyces bilateralis CBS 781.70 TaxID=1392243 RepID=A0A6G1G6J2_9PEZI|nr:uncharacterized protein P152DRAFT_287658 [Eremomyces bilateralis CBS 781.70]KAF1813658.1 hypothetical protein P152DRAFT_287658 [Eremomyces bilateralis CBS 781.70]